MQDPGACRKGLCAADDAVGEARAQGNEQVTAADAQVGSLGAVHAQHAGVAAVVAVKGALAHEGIADGGVNQVNELLQFIGGVRDDRAAADQDKGLAGAADHADRLVDLLLRDLLFGDREISVRDNGLVVTFGPGDILGDIDQNRAGTAGPGDGKGVSDGLCQVIDILDDPAVLGHGHGDAVDVDLLEGILAQQGQGHVAGDGHHGHTVHIGGRDAGHEIGRTGAAGRHADADFAGGPGIAVRRVGSTLFVGGQIVMDLVAVFIKRVIYVQDGTAGITENGIHALLQQALDDDIRTCHFHLDQLLPHRCPAGTVYSLGSSRIAPRLPLVTSAA